MTVTSLRGTRRCERPKLRTMLPKMLPQDAVDRLPTSIGRCSLSAYLDSATLHGELVLQQWSRCWSVLDGAVSYAELAAVAGALDHSTADLCDSAPEMRAGGAEGSEQASFGLRDDNTVGRQDPSTSDRDFRHLRQ